MSKSQSVLGLMSCILAFIHLMFKSVCLELLRNETLVQVLKLLSVFPSSAVETLRNQLVNCGLRMVVCLIN